MNAIVLGVGGLVMGMLLGWKPMVAYCFPWLADRIDDALDARFVSQAVAACNTEDSLAVRWLRGYIHCHMPTYLPRRAARVARFAKQPLAPATEQSALNDRLDALETAINKQREASW